MEVQVLHERSEESGTQDAKVSDSGYSNSYSNSQSQRSTGSSESRHSSSSGSSGYCGHQSTLNSVIENSTQQPVKRKDKDHKKKKFKQPVLQNAINNNESSIIANSSNSQSACVTQTGLTAEIVESPFAENSVITESVNEKNESIIEENFNVETLITPLVVIPPPLTNIRTPNGDSEALQIATVSQTFECIKKLNKNGINDVDINTEQKKKKPEEIIKCLKKDQVLEEELYIVVSMQDGLVLYTTPNLTEILGYPKDMWMGRSFIYFVHPRHRMAFASHISTQVMASQTDIHDSQQCTFTDSNGLKNPFYCCLRQYRGLKTAGFAVADKRVSYLPFQLNMAFKEVLTEIPQENPVFMNKNSENQDSIFLVINANVVRSAYTNKANDVQTNFKSPKFTMKHRATTHISHIEEPDILVSYLGYLPQDILGKSILDFYHPDDMELIKEIYQSVMKEQKYPMKSQPYRFRCQNGDFVLIETEWSAFINPWSRKVEFFIGKHAVIQAPFNLDVTTPVEKLEPVEVSEDIKISSKILEEEIKELLISAIGKNAENTKQKVSKRCKDVANFMESLMEMSKTPNLKVDIQNEEDPSFSERDSVMLGEISPHHDYYDSKSSSETPPSYNQLNYNENLQRFFESKPKTTRSDESSGSGGENINHKNETSITISANDSIVCGNGDSRKILAVSVCSGNENQAFCFHNSGIDSSGQSIESSNSAVNVEQIQLKLCVTGNNAKVTNQGYTPLTLTKQVLNKHNEDMEKQMVQKHKELRNKNDGHHHKSKDRYKHERIMEENAGHGLKRSGSHSFENEHFKSIKQSHNIPENENHKNLLSANNQHNMGNQSQRLSNNNGGNNKNSTNLWPPFSVNIAPLQNTTTFSAPAALTGGPIMPFYYISNPNQTHTENNSNLYQTNNQHPALITQQGSCLTTAGPPAMLYHHQLTMFAPTTPLLYTPVTFLTASPTYVHSNRPVSTPTISQTSTKSNNNPSSNNNNNNNNNSLYTTHLSTNNKQQGIPEIINAAKISRPPSQATSVKCEPPGSAMCSTASLKQTLSEKGHMTLESEMDVFDNLRYNSGNEEYDDRLESNDTSNIADDSSNYDSSFGSFLRTYSKSDESMKSSLENDNKESCMSWDRSSNKLKPTRKVAPWMEAKSFPDLMLKYQMEERKLEDVLRDDCVALKKINQPSLVNDQLNQMYLDLELFGLDKNLNLEERTTTTTSSSDSSPDEQKSQKTDKKKKKKKYMEYDKMAILYEENAPMPQPQSI